MTRTLRAGGFARRFLDKQLGRLPFWLLVAGLVLVRLLIAACQRVYLTPEGAPLDDMLMVRAAQSLVEGGWLGGYGAFAIAKHMGFALWLAGLHTLGLPLLVANTALWLAAAGFAAWALRPVFRGNLSRLVLFAFLAFQPFSWAPFTLRAYRDAIFPAFCLVLFAGVKTVPQGYNFTIERFGRILTSEAGAQTFVVHVPPFSPGTGTLTLRNLGSGYASDAISLTVQPRLAAPGSAAQISASARAVVSASPSRRSQINRTVRYPFLLASRSRSWSSAILWRRVCHRRPSASTISRASGQHRSTNPVSAPVEGSGCSWRGGGSPASSITRSSSRSSCERGSASPGPSSSSTSASLRTPRFPERRRSSSIVATCSSEQRRSTSAVSTTVANRVRETNAARSTIVRAGVVTGRPW